MATPQAVLNDLIAQRRERSEPSDDVQADLEHQWRLRNGDYDTNSVTGKAQQAWGAAEMVGKFVTGFVAASVSAVPSALLSMGEPSNPAWLAERDSLGIPRGPGDTDSFAEEFGLMTDFYTYQPRSAKGKRYNQVIEGVYNKYMVEKLHGYLMEQVSEGKLTPEEAVAIRTGAEGALLYAGVKGVRVAGGLAFRVGRGARGRFSGDTINLYDLDIPLKQLTATERYQRYNQEAPLKMLPPPEGALETAVSKAVKSEIPAKEVAKTIENAKTEVVAAEAIEKFVVEDNISQEQIGVRLQNQEVRDSLQWLGNELSVGGNIALVPKPREIRPGQTPGRLESTPRDEFGQPVADLIRTQSTNPEWFKQMNQHKETKMGVKKVWQTVDKAIAGKRLGARERRVVDLMLDTVEAMSEDYFANIPPAGKFPSRQSGAVNPDVIAEAVARALRPGIVTAKSMADIAHAVARQVAFKQVTDIRKINSPTAKMLADRIMPSEKSKIPLAGGFHELVSMKEGEYKTRLDSILAPLRGHVINKNVSSSLRIIGLPKKIN
ncbi:MAG: hypothetical protein IH859_05175, partial [Chloroflexi bacterium]|nr:hypothetical protein [Chloroflexota bacterium]